MRVSNVSQSVSQFGGEEKTDFISLLTTVSRSDSGVFGRLMELSKLMDVDMVV